MEVGWDAGPVHQEEGSTLGGSSGRGVDGGNHMALVGVGSPGQPNTQAVAGIFGVTQFMVDQG